MNAQRRLWLTPVGVRALGVAATMLILLLGSAGRGHAQYEPEFFTAKRHFFEARDSTPADVYKMMEITAGYYKYRDWLQVPWAKGLLGRSHAVVDRQRKLAELFDVFDDCFAPGEKGKQKATAFLQLHEELLGRQTPQKEIDKTAAVFHERLGKLPQAQRDRFKEIGREMKTVIKNEQEREAYLRRRAKEKAAAQKAVAELAQKDFGKLSHDEFIRLALAYNELGDNTRSLEAINQVPEAYLAKKGKLDLKAIAFHNVNFSLSGDKASLLRELAFLDRCIDRRYDNLGLWYWRKAKLLCRTSVTTEFHNRPSGAELRVIDREQYEYAYEMLKKAFEVEPNLLSLDSVAAEFLWSQDFPILSSEPRFKKLMVPRASVDAKEKRIIEAIEKLGGKVRVDPKKPGNPVIEVDFAYATVADVHLEILQDLQHLLMLDLHYTKITDKGLAHVKKITTLQGLHLHGLAITNVGMAHLAGLTDLRWLNITSTGVTSDGLKHLKGMSKLEQLQFGGIDDAGMAHLKGLTSLKALHLYQCFVTDAGLKHLEGLTNLHGLHFGSDKITNDGLKHLAKLKELRSLTLDVPPNRFGGGNPITDPGLEHLRGLTKLEHLSISATGVTSAGVKRLQQALPKLKIDGRRSQVPEQD
jgi:tetratricopeptide (TPR) repeat protein